MGYDDSSNPEATERLVSFTAETKYEDLPTGMRRLLKRMIVDTVGVAVAGSGGDPHRRILAGVQNYRSTTSAEESVSVIGTRRRVEPDLAALLTGIDAHADDFDDVHETMLGHPSAPVLAATLPVAEYRGASGRELLRAFAVGVEAETRLGDALNPVHYDRGWHPTAIIGTVGAAVAVGVLLGLDRVELRRTIGFACSQAGGIKANFGTAVKPYHVGRAARCGVEAGHVAAAGASASEDALEREFGGFVDLFGAGDGASEAIEFPRQSEDWRITDPEVAFKPYPCCRSTHAPIDAALAVHEEWGEEPPTVERVDIVEHPRRIPHTDCPDPQSDTDAKFSVQYCTSLALAQGEVWLTDFAEDAVVDPDRRAYLDAVAVHSDEDHPEWGATVRIMTADGTTREQSVDTPRGSPSRPLSDNELNRKFRRCVETSLSVSRAEDALELLQSLEEIDDVGVLADTLVPGSGPSD